MDVNIKLDRRNKVPLFIQIANQITNSIDSGLLKPGTRLPAERKLAGLLGVNRSTVINAYGELATKGYVNSHIGRGTIVAIPVPTNKTETFRWQELLSGQGESLINHYNSAMAELLSQRDLIAMDSGIAAPELYPTKHFSNICKEILLTEGDVLLQHNCAQGLATLRESISSIMKLRQVDASTDDIIVLNGSQQGLDIIARILIEPGDCIIVEQPCFLGAIDIFRAYGAKLIGIPVDSEGMVVDQLERILNRVRPKFIYTNPTYHNPTGACMSLSRRKTLLELAHKHQVPILEDDAYGLLNYDSPSLPAIKSMDETGLVIYVSTMSKTLCPGLRLGWMIAPPDLVRLVAAAKQTVDLHNNNLIQRMVDLFYRNDLMEKHLAMVKEIYKIKKDTMLKALEKHAPAEMSWNNPAGGFYIWATLPENMSALRLLQEAVNKKVSFVAGPTFYNSDDGQDKIRLNFTFASPEMIETGIKILCQVIKELQVKNRGIKKDSNREIKLIV